MESHPVISVVSPVYKAEKIVDELVKRISREVSAITPQFEIILVEDGSPDQSWAKIEQNCQLNPHVKGIKLSRNYGQHYAISAGLTEARGDYVVVMDCDLQDDPKYIATLYSKAKEGFDIVYTLKKKRKHSFFKNITARLFFYIFNALLDNKMNSAEGTVGGYSMLSRKALNAFNQIKDFHRHYLMIVRLLGFNSAYVIIEHQERFEGNSSYSFNKLLAHAVDGITSQTDKLLRLSVIMGFIMFFLSLIGAITLLTHYIISGVATPGYTSLMLLLLASTGLILISLGITGIYIGKIFDQVKNRPLYIIDKKLNF